MKGGGRSKARRPPQTKQVHVTLGLCEASETRAGQVWGSVKEPERI